MKKAFLLFVMVHGLLYPARAEETPSTKAILARALSIAREIDDDHSRALALVDVLYAQARIGDPQAVHLLEGEVLEAAKAVSAGGSRDKLLQRIIAVKAGSWLEAYENETTEGAIDYLETVGVRPPTSETTQAERARLRDAIAISRLIEDPETRFWALWSIVRPAIEKGRFILMREPIAEAQSVAKSISDESTRVEIFTIIAWLQTLMGDRLAARSTLAEAISTARLIEYDYNRVRSFCSIATTQFAAGDKSAANASADEGLSVARLAALADILGEIATCEAKIGNTSLALATVRAIGDTRERVYALIDVATAQTTMSDAGTAELLQEAVELLQRIEDRDDYQDWLLRMSQTALASPVRMRDLLSIVIAVRKHYFFYFWGSARMAIAAAAPITRSFDAVMATLERAEDPEIRLNELWLLGEALLLAGDQPALQRLTREALEIVEPAIAAGGSNIDVFDFDLALPIIALAQAEGGDSEGALRTVDRMLALLAASDTLLRQAATVRARAGAMALAIVTTEGIVDPAIRVRALTAVAMAGRSGRVFYLNL